MKFNEKLYELTKNLKVESEELTEEETALEQKVINAIYNRAISDSKIENGNLVITFEELYEFESCVNDDYLTIMELIERGSFNKVMNQYHIYIESSGSYYSFGIDVGYIKIMWDYKRYMEDLKNSLMKTQINTYEKRKKILECENLGHDFEDWQYHNSLKPTISLFDGFAFEENTPCYSRVCKRCGLMEKRNSLEDSGQKLTLEKDKNNQ